MPLKSVKMNNSKIGLRHVFSWVKHFHKNDFWWLKNVVTDRFIFHKYRWNMIFIEFRHFVCQAAICDNYASEKLSRTAGNRPTVFWLRRPSLAAAWSTEQADLYQTSGEYSTLSIGLPFKPSLTKKKLGNIHFKVGQLFVKKMLWLPSFGGTTLLT